MKNLSEMELTDALFICIDNFRLEEQSDECLYLLLRYTQAYAETRPTQTSKSVPYITIRWTHSTHRRMQNRPADHGQKPRRERRQAWPLQLIGQAPPIIRYKRTQIKLRCRWIPYQCHQHSTTRLIQVNIEIGKTHAIIVTVEKEFARIFKMLVDKGATLVFNNEDTILHIIMRKKFNDPRKKKKFIKELANRPQLSQSRDKMGKLPIDYETQDDIKGYYNELFKPKQKVTIEK